MSKAATSKASQVQKISLKEESKKVIKASVKKAPEKKASVKKASVKKASVKKAPEKKEDAVSEVTGELPSKPKKRRVLTPETVLASFDDLIALVDAEIIRRRESPGKAKGVKFLRTVNKKLKTLNNQSARAMKQKRPTTRKNNGNSGFLKPVKISKEMAKFTGWDHEELKSRVSVTKHICDYIKEHDLQNPADRRQIVVDNKLSKLLNYDKKNDDQPLTYFRLQTYLKPHFPKDEKKDDDKKKDKKESVKKE